VEKKVSMKLEDFVTNIDTLSRKLMDLDLAKTEFLLGISRTVHSTMEGVIGMLDIVLDENVSEKVKDCLYTARSSANGLVSMMNDIVDISDIDSDTMKVERCHCSLSDVLLDVESVMDCHLLEAGHAFEMTLVGPIPETVYTDPIRLRQCLFDLVQSTVKELGSDQVTMAVSCEQGTDESWLHFEITAHCHTRGHRQQTLCQDYGNRIDAILKHEDQLHDRPKGVDLGLMVARQLSDLLGGRLSLKHGTDHALCLSLAIPFGLEGHPVNMTTEMTRGKPGAEATDDKEATSFKGNVLLADDDLVDQRVMASILRDFGLNVTVVSGGSEALEQGRKGKYDMMILDIIMPDIDGREVASRLREQGLDIPIVTVTGSVVKLDHEACVASGCNAHLAKPLAPEPLAKVLAKYLKPNDDPTDAKSESSCAEPCTLADAREGE
jgi:CheY-like chemotaxis protein